MINFDCIPSVLCRLINEFLCRARITAFFGIHIFGIQYRACLHSLVDPMQSFCLCLFPGDNITALPFLFSIFSAQREEIPCFFRK